MAINPREYDLDELRESVGNSFSVPAEPPDASSANGTLEAGHYRELLLLQSQSGGQDLEKPYLRTLPTTHDGERATFEWLESLTAKGGFKRTYEALRHYRSLEWLTEPVENGLRDYLAGVPEPDQSETRPFDQSDHLLSLIYIGRIAAL